MTFIEEKDVDRRDATQQRHHAEHGQVGPQSTRILGRLICGLQQRADYVAHGLSHKHDGGGGLSLGVARDVLGFPRVYQRR